MRIRIVLPAIMLGVGLSSPPDAVAASRHQPRPAAPSAPAWPPTQCGREPVAPTVDTSTIDRYNSSVDRVTLYERSARTFNACVSRAATVQQTAISDDARSRIDAIQQVSSGVQKRIATNFELLTTSLRAGAPKLQPTH